MDYFLDHFLDQFLDPFLGPFFKDNFPGEGRPLALREGRDAIYQFSGRCGKQIVVTEGGEGQTINTQGGVGVCFISKCY